MINPAEETITMAAKAGSVIQADVQVPPVQYRVGAVGWAQVAMIAKLTPPAKFSGIEDGHIMGHMAL